MASSRVLSNNSTTSSIEDENWDDVASEADTVVEDDLATQAASGALPSLTSAVRILRSRIHPATRNTNDFFGRQVLPAVQTHSSRTWPPSPQTPVLQPMDNRQALEPAVYRAFREGWQPRISFLHTPHEYFESAAQRIPVVAEAGLAEATRQYIQQQMAWRVRFAAEWQPVRPHTQQYTARGIPVVADLDPAHQNRWQQTVQRIPVVAEPEWTVQYLRQQMAQRTLVVPEWGLRHQITRRQTVQRLPVIVEAEPADQILPGRTVQRIPVVASPESSQHITRGRTMQRNLVVREQEPIQHITRGRTMQRGPVAVREQQPRRHIARERTDERTQMQRRASDHDYHTSMIPPVRRRGETIDEFIVRLRAHLAFIENRYSGLLS